MVIERVRLSVSDGATTTLHIGMIGTPGGLYNVVPISFCHYNIGTKAQIIFGNIRRVSILAHKLVRGGIDNLLVS